MRIHFVTPVAGHLEPPLQGLTHDHPQGIAGRNTMAAGQHEFIPIRMFRATVVVA